MCWKKKKDKDERLFVIKPIKWTKEKPSQGIRFNTNPGDIVIFTGNVKE